MMIIHVMNRLRAAGPATTTGEGVDFVIETGGRLLPIEVKATARSRLADCAGLRSFRAEYGDHGNEHVSANAGATRGVRNSFTV